MKNCVRKIIAPLYDSQLMFTGFLTLTRKPYPIVCDFVNEYAFTTTNFTPNI